MKDSFKNYRFNTLYLVLAFMSVVFVQQLFVQSSIQQVAYSEFIKMLEAGEIEEVIVNQDSIKGIRKEPTDWQTKQFSTNRVEPGLSKILSASGVKYAQASENTLIKEVLSWVLPTLILIAVWLLMMRRMNKGIGGTFMSVGKSKAKVYVEKNIKVNFKDVAGAEEAKQELQEIVSFLKDSAKFRRLGGRMPKGILLVGPPGTGKTLIAKALAGEASVPFFSISGSEFVEMFVGVGAARVRDLFEQARKAAPCIIFVDELDALGKARSASPLGGGNDEKEQTLNQLLTELDGFDSGEGIILVGATNRPEILDPALLRSGRFDRQILVDRPDKQGRLEILNVHVKKVRAGEDIDLEKIAGLTTGFTGADLANLVNEAALIATRRNAEFIIFDDFTQGIERLVAGLEKKNRILNQFERKVTAYHEMGHAIVAFALKSSDVVHKVSIIPRGVGALGYTIQRPLEDRFLMKKSELIKKITVLMGGRAAESTIFEHLSTGASDDLAKATDIAKNMVTRYGMDEGLGSVTFQKEQNTFLGQSGYEPRDYSEETAREIDVAVKQINKAAYQQALRVLSDNREILEKSALLLIDKETLDEQELAEVFKEVKVDTGATSALGEGSIVG